jgi:hypothetical protein
MSTMAEVEMRKTKASEAEKALEAAESDMRPRLEELFGSRGTFPFSACCNLCILFVCLIESLIMIDMLP